MKNKKKSGGRARRKSTSLPILFLLCCLGVPGQVLAMEAEEGDSRSGLPAKFSTPTKFPASSAPQPESPRELTARVNRWLAAQARNFFPRRPAHTGDSKS